MDIFSFLFWWIFLSIIVAILAGARGRSGPLWLFLSLLISPVICGLIVLAAGKPVPTKRTHKQCPDCAEWCAKEANICRHCRHSFVPTPSATTPTPTTQEARPQSISTGDFIG